MSSNSEVSRLKLFHSIVSLGLGIPAFVLFAAGLAAFSFDFPVIPILEDREVARTVLIAGIVVTLLEAGLVIILQSKIKELQGGAT